MDYISSLAMNAWVLMNPSVAWANQQIEPHRGLPFAPYLHASRPRRPRTLTTPLDMAQDPLWHKLLTFTSVEPEQQTNEQFDCMFLTKLPAEIRMIIYEMVLGNLLFHLSAGNPRMRIVHAVCKVPHLNVGEQLHRNCHNYSARPQSDGSRSSGSWNQDEGDGLNILSFLLTCRKIYSEAVDTLYTSNTFEFTQNFCILRFLRIMIPSQRLKVVRHIHFFMRLPRHPALNSRAKRDWEGLWNFFDFEMPGLQNLHIRLAMLQPMEVRILETNDKEGADWIRPVVRMALNAYERRRCVVHIVVAEVTLDLVELVRELSGMWKAQVVDWVQMEDCCSLIHQRIRLALARPRL